MTNLPIKANNNLPVVEEGMAVHEFVTMFIDGQLFGIPVLQVQDVLGPQRIAHVPLAPKEVAGSLNLRGRIVTAIDVRVRLGLPSNQETAKNMSVVVDYTGEFYSLLVDQVGEVMGLPATDYEKTPATLNDRWKEISDGVYRLKNNLLIVLDVKRLLRLEEFSAA
jgi:purine-binding chemotaxis protein CheW